MEVESSFLSIQQDHSSENARLPKMLRQVMQDLNSHKMCTLTGVYYLLSGPLLND